MQRILIAFVLTASTLSLRAEKAPSKVQETSDVSLVEVPVNVVGRDGKPIAGLTIDDFQIEDDGKTQKIVALDVADLKKRNVAPDLPGLLPAAARRHFLLLFDLSFATPNEIVKSRQAAMNFVSETMEPEDLAAVAVTTVERGAHLLLTFTSDRRQLAAAIRTLGLPNLTDQVRDPLAFAYIMPGDPFANKMLPTEEVTQRLDQEVIASMKVYAMMAQKSADNFAVSRVERYLGGMGSLASALDAVEGRKTIIYFTEGFDGSLILGNMLRSNEDNAADNEDMVNGRIWAVDVDKRYSNAPLQREIAETLTLFGRSDCVVYPIDIAGLKADGDVTLGASSRGEESLYLIASQTGGEVIKNANDLTAQMKRIAEKTSLTYVLSFQPTRSREEGRFHRLRVKVRAKGARVSARAGYYEARSFRMLTPLERTLAAADVITHESSRGDIPIRVIALPLAGERLSRVPVLVRVPESLADQKKGRLQLGIYVYVTDTEGKLADYFTRSVAVDLAHDSGRFLDGGMTYFSICRLSPGSYRVRAFVRDEESGRFGFQIVELSVPDFTAREMRALPPIFLNGNLNGINLRDSAVDTTDIFQVGDTAFVPRLDPKLSAGVASRICLMLYQKGDGIQSSPVDVFAEVVGSDGASRGRARLSVVGRTQPDAAGLIKILVDFIPEPLPPGEYSLKIDFRDSHDRSLHSESEARFTVS